MVNNIVADTAKVFKDVRIVDCVIGDYACIGDDSDLVGSVMSDRSELGRRNIIRNSTIGRGSYTGTNTIIKNASIGNYCMIGWNVSIGGGNHNTGNVSMYTDYWYKRTFGIEADGISQNEIAEPVVIGSDVWIGAGANILNGVEIGDGAVIAAGAVVIRNVPPYCIVGGVPAKTLKYRFDTEIIKMLEIIRWWDWPEQKIKDNMSFLRNKPSFLELAKYLE